MASGKTVAHYKVDFEQFFSSFAKADVIVNKTNKSLKTLASDGTTRASTGIVNLSKSISTMRPTAEALAQSLNRLHATTAGIGTRLKVLQSTVDRSANSIRAKNSVLNTLNTTMTRTASAAGSASGGIRKTADETKKATAASKGLLLSWQSLVRLLTIQVLHQAVSLMSMALRRAADDAKQLQLKLAEVRAISDGVFLSIGDWGSGLRAISEKWGSDILQLTEAAYQTVSNQIAQGSEAIKFVESASRLALAAVGSQTDAVNALSAVMNAYKMELKDTDRVAAMLFETIKLGRTRLVNLGQDLGQVTPIAAQLGISINDLLGSIASLEILGMSSSEAVTQMRNVFLRLLRPTKEMQQVITDLGYPSAQAMFQVLDLADAFEAMRTAAKGNIDVITALNPRIRGMGATMEFTERRGLARLRMYSKKLSEAGEDYVKRAEEIMKTDAKKWEQATNTIKNTFLLDVGPALLKMLVAINGETNRLADFVKVLSLVIGTGLVAALGYALTKIALLAAAFPVVTVAAYATAIGLGLLVEAFNLHGKVTESNRDSWTRWSRTLQVVLGETAKEIEKNIKIMDDAVAAAYLSITTKINKETEKTFTILESMFKGYSVYFKDALKSVEDGIKDITKEIENLQKAQEKVDGFIKGFHLDAEKQMFQFLLDDADAVAKFDLWQNRIKVLSEQQRMAMEAGDSDEVARIGKEINAAHVQLKGLQDNLAENDIRKAKDVATAYWEANRNTIDMLTKLKEEMHKEELKRINDLAEEERRQDRITALMKRTEQVSVIDMMKKEMPKDPRMRQIYLQDLKGMFGQYMDAMDQIRDISGKTMPEELGGAGDQMAKYIKQKENMHQTMLLEEKSAKARDEWAISLAKATEINDKNKVAAGKLEQELIPLRVRAEELAAEFARANSSIGVVEANLAGKRVEEYQKEIEDRVNANKALIEAKEAELNALNRQTLEQDAIITKLNEQSLTKIGLGEIEKKVKEDSIQAFEAHTKKLREILNILPDAMEILKKAPPPEAPKDSAKKPGTVIVDGVEYTRDPGGTAWRPKGDAAGGKAFGGPSYGSESKFMTPGEMIMSADSTRKFFNQYMTGNSNVASASGSNVNIGDINVTMQAHGNVNYDAQRLGNMIRREIRQGMLVL